MDYFKVYNNHTIYESLKQSTKVSKQVNEVEPPFMLTLVGNINGGFFNG